MTVELEPYIITDIVEMQKAEMSAMGMTIMKNPDLDMYRMTAVMKCYIEKTKKGRKILEKLGHGDKLSEVEMKYLEYEESFTAFIPITHKSLNWNKYEIGGEIMIAYYPTNVWATFHAEGEPDNINDHKRLQG